jgi:hypothetical protein
MNTKSFPVSFFKSKFDATPKEKYLTFQEFNQLAENPSIQREKDGELFTPGLFEPKHRKKENVKIISMAVFDIDHNGDFETIKSAFEKLNCKFSIYSTHSHLRYIPATKGNKGNPNTEPRFRVCVPLATDIPPKKFPQLWACIKQITGLPFDEGAKDASRMFYLPAKASEDAPYTHYLNEGEFLEWEPLLENISDSIIEKAATKPPIQKPKNELEKGENKKTVNNSNDVPRTAQGWDIDFVLDETRDIPSAKLDAFLLIDPKIKKTWEHKRKDLIDQSASSYDFSLINFAITYGWDNQELVDLMIAHRKKYGEDLQLDKKENYYARTIHNARTKHFQSSEINAAINLEPDSDRQTNLDAINTAFGLNISRIEKYKSTPPAYTIYFKDGRKASLGDAKGLIIQNNLRERLANATDYYLPTFNKQNWDKIAQKLLKACEELEPIADAIDEGATRSWLESYLSYEFSDIGIGYRQPISSLVLMKAPLFKDSKVYFTLQEFKRWIERETGERHTRNQLSFWLKNIGCEHTKIDVSAKQAGRQPTSRSYFIAPDDIAQMFDYLEEFFSELPD